LAEHDSGAAPEIGLMMNTELWILRCDVMWEELTMSGRQSKLIQILVTYSVIEPTVISRTKPEIGLQEYGKM